MKRNIVIIGITILAIFAGGRFLRAHAEIKKQMKQTVSQKLITYGSVIRLCQREQDVCLALQPPKKSSSKKLVLYGGKCKPHDKSFFWLIRGPWDTDEWGCHVGQPVKEGDQIRLEHLDSGFFLAMKVEAHYEQDEQKVPYAQNAKRDLEKAEKDQQKEEIKQQGTWTVREVTTGSDGVLTEQSGFSLYNDFQGVYISVNPKKTIPSDRSRSKKVVESCESCLEQMHFSCQLVSHPGEADKSLSRWLDDRGGLLFYNTLVWIDPVSTGRSRFEPLSPYISEHHNERRLWTIAASRHDEYGKALELHQHAEILAGPGNSPRAQGPASFFILQSVDDPSKRGPIQFGDKFRIVSPFAAAGTKKKSGRLTPAKGWWVNNESRWGDQYAEIVVSDPVHPAIKDERSYFIIEPELEGLTGDVHQRDPIRIRNCAYQKPVLWLHATSRYGKKYYELLANNEDDEWGKSHSNIANSRDKIWHRFRIHHVRRRWVFPHDREIYDDFMERLRQGLYGFGLSDNLSESVASMDSKEEWKKLVAVGTLNEVALEIKRERKKDKARLAKKNLKREARLPYGFVPVKGHARDVAIGFQRRGSRLVSTALAVDNRGFLMTWRDGINPWVRHYAYDENGVKLSGFTSVAVGKDAFVGLTKDGLPMMCMMTDEPSILPRASQQKGMLDDYINKESSHAK